MKSGSTKARSRSQVPWLPAALVTVALCWGAQAVTQRANAPLNPIAQKHYWEKQHQREEQQRTAEERWQNEHREKIKTAAAEIVKSQAAIQSELILAEDGPSKFKPETPSLFSRYPEQVTFGVTLVIALAIAAQMCFRIRRQAEIRKLCGGYLSDGTEVARYKLPDWFAPAPRAEQPAEESFAKRMPSSLEVKLPTPVADFFEQAPARLEQIRNVLKELGGAGPLEESQKALLKAHELICELKVKANCWDLRPAWQMSSAIELLLMRVADKPKDMTSSIVRTIAAALDVLHEVCVPGVRANLLNDPPLKILAVDDDPLCRRALQFALEKAHFATDLAENGEKAVELAAAHAYDVVFMDIQMPGIDGLTACGQIHETKKNADVPVVFVTVQSDFNTRAQLRLKGGADLMAKPFLIFELTVRAVTFAMRKRLQAASSSRREMVFMKPALPQPAVAASPEPVLAVPAPQPDAAPPTAPVDGLPISVTELTGDFFSAVPEYLAATRRIVDELRTMADPGSARESMGELYLRVHAIATRAGRDNLAVAAHVSSTLESLLKRLYGNPKIVSTSTLNTVSKALRQLEILCVPGAEEKLADHPPLRILVVDDEPLARRAVVGALQLTFKQPQSAHDGTTGSALAAKNPYDVIFTDVQMPDMDGFELCRAIRDGGINADTPVVFITNHTDVESQALAAACGGNDFIGKPFLPIEITVKALTFAWDCRLRKINGGAAANPFTEIQSQHATFGNSADPSQDPVDCAVA